MTEIETMTPEGILAAFVTEGERLVARLRSGALVLLPGDAVDLVLRIRVLTTEPTGESESESDPAA